MIEGFNRGGTQHAEKGNESFHMVAADDDVVVADAALEEVVERLVEAQVLIFLINHHA